ncbi:MAG: BT_3928 family protein [Bacteroidales bacterium]
MRLLFNISRYVTGIVFTFSGLVKGIDPMGSMYKFTDYFTAFGMNSNDTISLILGILLAATEFIIGFALITGIRYREAAWGLLLFMSLFTPLTLILALTNPVSDCGCFGDAIHLTNWQTFFKNLVLMIFVIPAFILRKMIKSYDPISGWVSAAAAMLLFILLSLYSYRHLPVIDFRPYRPGVNIEEAMSVPEGAPVDEYETLLIYEKDGEQKEFTLENYPSGDDGWEFIDQKSTLVSKGYRPPITDFILTSGDGYDLTSFMLGNQGTSLLMISAGIEKADREDILKGFEAAELCISEGIDFWFITSSSASDIPDEGSSLNHLFGDETMLKTVVRSNPGYMVISNGTITTKWAARDLPETGQIIESVYNSTENIVYNKNARLGILYGAILIVIIAIRIYTARWIVVE